MNTKHAEVDRLLHVWEEALKKAQAAKDAYHLTEASFSQLVRSMKETVKMADEEARQKAADLVWAAAGRYSDALDEVMNADLAIMSFSTTHPEHTERLRSSRGEIRNRQVMKLDWASNSGGN